MALSLLNKDIKDYSKEDWVQFLQATEKRGGSAGLKKLLDSPPEKLPFKDPKDFPSTIPANLNLAALLFATYVDVNTAGDHSGSGWGIGFGAGGAVSAGILGYSSWEELTSAENTFVIGSVEEGIVATWFINGSPVAGFAGAGIGLELDVSGGTFNWE